MRGNETALLFYNEKCLPPNVSPILYIILEISVHCQKELLWISVKILSSLFAKQNCYVILSKDFHGYP